MGVWGPAASPLAGTTSAQNGPDGGVHHPDTVASAAAHLLYPSTVSAAAHPATLQLNKVKPRNPIYKKHRATKLFQTLNQAKTVWDPRCKVKGLFCGHLNIRSMINKCEQLEDLLMHLNIDCLGLTETWLKPLSPEALMSMPGYNVFRNDRVKGKGGGALLYVKNTLDCEQIKWPNEIQAECVRVNITLSTEMSFTLLYLYRHPSAQVEYYEQLKTILNTCNLNKEVIIMGDLNVNGDDKKGRENLKQNRDYFNLSQLIEQPARVTSHSRTRIDLLFSNRAERITKTYNFLTGMSDHNIMFFSRKLSKKRLNRPHRPQPFASFIPKNLQQNFVAALKHLEWDEIFLCDDTDSGCSVFLSKISEVMEAFTRRGSYRKGQRVTLPWIDENCRNLIKKETNCSKSH